MINSQKLILGTVQFGLNYGINNRTGIPQKDEVFRILNYAFNNGISVLDSAEAYGTAVHLIKEYSREYPFKFKINSKFNNSDRSLSEVFNETYGNLNAQIDTFFYHSFNDFFQYPSLLSELKVLKSEGLIKSIGLSIYEDDEFKAAIDSEDIDVIQIPFNLLDNFALRGAHLKEARLKGKTIQARSIFLQGLFFKPHNEIPPFLSKLTPMLKEITKIAEAESITVEELAFRYALNQPDIDYILIGVDSFEQLQRNLSINSDPFSAEICERIESLVVSDKNLLYPKNWN